MRPSSHQRFRLLDSQMTYHGVTRTDIAEALNKSRGYVSARFSGEREWEIDDAYQILKMIKAPEEALSKFFPKK